MDKIIIKDLEIFAYHGVFEEEKINGQKFYISIELELSLRKAGMEDSLTDTVHYGELCQDVGREFTRCKYDLIEKAAEELAKYILMTRAIVNAVKVLIKKPSAPIGMPLEYVAVEIERGRNVAYIGLGSNLGDKNQNIESALEMMKEFATINTVSKLIVTKPVGGVPQDDFLNGAAQITTLLTPIELLHALQGIEKELKRERLIKWGPRTIDLDILMYNDIVMSSAELAIPHPYMDKREFALEPMCEIAPFAVHPLKNKRMTELLEELINK